MKIVRVYPREKNKFHFGYLSLEIDDFIFHSDSLFSSLCNNYIKKEGEDIERFINNFPKISSLFYGLKNGNKEILFIPKPINFIIPSFLIEKDRKLPKKIKFISLGVYYKYINSNLDNEKSLQMNKERDCIYLKEEFPTEELKLFDSFVEEKVQIDRRSSKPQEKSLYQISSICPEKDIFFYFFIDEKEIDEDLEKSIKGIELFGLGGKITTGYGCIKKVEIEDFELNLGKSEKYTNLSIVFPKRSELENTESYELIERKGYVYYSSLRKKPLIGLKEGAVFNSKIEGGIVDVSPNEKIKAKKFGKAFLIPIK
ncbi:MAG: type III-A CRISPR-associated RAMP protein Csm4 [Candidatus Pacearchaeota archaeon]